jgi:hypothetical protein
MSPSPLTRSKPVQSPLQDSSPSSSNLTEDDNSPRYNPRMIVRKVVERTSDKLGRSKSLGTKSQHSPKSQRSSLTGSPKRFLSQNRPSKDQQTTSTGGLGGTCSAYAFSASFRITLVDVVEGSAPAQMVDNGFISASPSSESSPTKHLLSDESPFIRPSSPTQPHLHSSVPTFQGDTSACVLRHLPQLYLTSFWSTRCVQGLKLLSKHCKPFRRWMMIRRLTTSS